MLAKRRASMPVRRPPKRLSSSAATRALLARISDSESSSDLNEKEDLEEEEEEEELEEEEEEDARYELDSPEVKIGNDADISISSDWFVLF